METDVKALKVKFSGENNWFQLFSGMDGYSNANSSFAGISITYAKRIDKANSIGDVENALTKYFTKAKALFEKFEELGADDGEPAESVAYFAMYYLKSSLSKGMCMADLNVGEAADFVTKFWDKIIRW